MPNDLRRWGLRILHHLRAPTLGMLNMLVVALSSVFKTRAALQLENLALRHQLGVLHRSVKKPKLTPLDRLLWAWLCGVWPNWRSALIVVKPETVIAWQRKGFRLLWTAAVQWVLPFPLPASSPPVRSKRVCSVSAAAGATRRRPAPSVLAPHSMRRSTRRCFPAPRCAGAIARAFPPV